MATAMRILHASSSVVTSPQACAGPAPPQQSTLLRCAWKGKAVRVPAFAASTSQLGNVKKSSRCSFGPSGGTGALTPELRESLDKYLSENKVVLFMKGNKMFPQCGFSNTCVQILNKMNVPFETVNILEDDSLRQGMKEYSAWPTFPQLYIDGEFFGGCDITLEAFSSGELKEVLEKAMLS